MGRGQISMEYLLVAAFAFLLLVPIILIAYTQSARFSSDVSASQVQKIGNELTDAVNEVHYAGPPTKKTVRLYFPENIRTVELRNQTILFTMQGSSGSYEYAAFASANMSGSLQSFPGIHRVTVTAGEGRVNVTDG